MSKSHRRRAESTRKAFKRSAAYKAGGNKKGTSNYARKRAYCVKHGVWGFEVPIPKPWKRAA
jgi:hypothetical protein